MFYIVSLFWILSINGLLVIVTKKRFEEVCTISFVLGTLLLYLFGFINHIRIGYYISLGLCAIFWIILLYCLFKKKDSVVKEFKNNYFTIGFIVFFVIILFLFVLYRFKGFSFCDEFMHWGPMVKESFRLDGFYSQADSLLLVHKDYPPFFSLLETLWCLFGGKYSEGYLYIGIVSFMFSMFMPVFEKHNIRNKKDWLKSALYFLLIILVGLVIGVTETSSDSALVYNSIYVDWTLAVLVAYSMCFVFKESEWSIFSLIKLSLCLIAMLLSKQMGLPFYLLVLLMFVLKQIFIDKNRRIIIYILLLMIIPAIFFISWNYVKNLYDLTGQFELGSIHLGDIFGYITGNTELTWKHDVFTYFVSSVLKRKITIHPIGLSYPLLICIVIALLLFISGLNKKTLLLSGTYLFGSVAYCFAMLLLYLFMFSIEEAISLASFNRYMLTYVYIGFSLFVMLISSVKDEISYYVISLLIIIVFVDYHQIRSIIPKLSITNNNTEDVCVIEQFYTGVTLDREDVNGYKFNFKILDYINAYDDAEKMIVEKDKFLNSIKGYDYLYILSYDGPFYEYWKLIKPDNHYLENGSLFKIVVNEKNRVDLELIDYGTEYYMIKYYAMSE